MAATMLDVSRPHVLRSEKEYEAAVREIDAQLDADPVSGSAAYDRLEFLSVLVRDFEERHYPIKRSTPQELRGSADRRRGLMG